MPLDHRKQQQKVGCHYPFSRLHRKHLDPVKIEAFLKQFEQEWTQNSRASAANAPKPQDPEPMCPMQGPWLLFGSKREGCHKGELFFRAMLCVSTGHGCMPQSVQYCNSPQRGGNPCLSSSRLDSSYCVKIYRSLVSFPCEC